MQPAYLLARSGQSGGLLTTHNQYVIPGETQDPRICTYYLQLKQLCNNYQ
jgi:hypothetical protein